MDCVRTLAGQGEHATLVQHPERLPDKDSMSKDGVKKIDERRRYEEIKHIRVCWVRPRGLGTSSVDLPI